MALAEAQLLHGGRTARGQNKLGDQVSGTLDTPSLALVACVFGAAWQSVCRSLIAIHAINATWVNVLRHSYLARCSTYLCELRPLHPLAVVAFLQPWVPKSLTRCWTAVRVPWQEKITPHRNKGYAGVGSPAAGELLTPMQNAQSPTTVCGLKAMCASMRCHRQTGAMDKQEPCSPTFTSIPQWNYFKAENAISLAQECLAEVCALFTDVTPAGVVERWRLRQYAAPHLRT